MRGGFFQGQSFFANDNSFLTFFCNQDNCLNANNGFFFFKRFNHYFRALGDVLFVIEKYFFPDGFRNKKPFRFITHFSFRVVGGTLRQ